MGKKCFLILALSLATITLWGQKLISEKSSITFFSEAPIEDIKATSTKSTSLYDANNGDIVFSVPINSFTFRKSLMQKHFNENYLESDQYPKAKFEGKIKGYQLGTGKQTASAEGNLTIHGKTKKVRMTGEMEQRGDKLFLKAVFPVKLEDYKIKIPKILFNNIAEVVEVTVEFQYKSYE